MSKDRAPSGSREPPSYPIASVDNALRLLLLFQQRREWRMSEIARELDVADSTAHRLIAMLEYHGFLERMPSTKGYRIGPSITVLGRNALGGNTLREVVHPVLAQIVEQEDETISLGVLEGSDIRYIDAIESNAVLRVGNRTGMKIPAHCTSAGKLLLAELEQDELLSRYPDEQLQTVTNRSIGSRTELFEQLDEIRERGYATSVAASEEGIASLAVPVRDSVGRAVAAAALAAPINRFETWDQPDLAQRMTAQLAPFGRLLPIA